MESTMKSIILIVDDDPTNAEILSEYLKKSEFETILSQNGLHAIAQCKKLDPDLILLDVMMPDMDGFETCAELKKHENTREIPVIFTTALSDTASKIRGFEVGGVDYITKPFHPEEVLARVNAHLTIRKQQQQLQRQTEQLTLLNAEKDTFLSMIAHDLRSPFSSLRLLIGLAAENVEGSGQNELEHIMGLLKKSSENLYNLLDNLLAWSRIQQGVVRYHPKTIDVGQMVVQNLALLDSHAHQKQIEFKNTIEENTTVYADYHMVDAIIRNLISNALKFTHPGGCIHIFAVPGDEFLTISVKDTGIGIAVEHLPGLFRIDSVYRRKGTARESGSGLGLILCKEFVEKNGGSIGVESEEEKGSTFYFRLPLPPFGD
jgi:signal transduction histidine kinase